MFLEIHLLFPFFFVVGRLVVNDKRSCDFWIHDEERKVFSQEGLGDNQLASWIPGFTDDANGWM
jgi:hypothetical protein